MIRISVKGLAKYMTSGPAGQRRILKNFKEPHPYGEVMFKYYAEAREAIRNYHRGNNDPSTLVSEARRLTALAERADGSKKTRLEQNVEAIVSYLKHFSGRKFKVLSTPR